MVSDMSTGRLAALPYVLSPKVVGAARLASCKVLSNYLTVVWVPTYLT